MSGPASLNRALEGSVLVVAHPDDEILWFGSIAADVDKIVICFLNDPLKPELAGIREKTLRAHPWSDKITCLELDETSAFNHAGWPRPETTEFGLRIVKAPQIEEVYRLCYDKLQELLTPIVRNATNVFTHNPWGEYGHEEHVLVHSVATKLAVADQKSVWYSNYASTWSEDLMRLYLDKSERQIFTGKVDTAALEKIADIYRANGAWTWFDDYTWFADEFFVRGPLTQTGGPGFGWLFPINLLRLPDRELPAHGHRKPLLYRAIKRLTGR